MSRMEVYKPEEIAHVLDILETVQDALQVEDAGVLWDMLQEVIDVLYYVEDDE